MFKKIFLFCWVLFLAVSTVGCVSGMMRTVDFGDGTTAEVRTAGYTGVASRGAQITEVKFCDASNQCGPAQSVPIHNPTILEQIAGPAAVGYAGHEVGEGIENGGDTTNVSATGGDGGNSASFSGSWSNSSSSGGCKGNCK